MIAMIFMNKNQLIFLIFSFSRLILSWVSYISTILFIFTSFSPRQAIILEMTMCYFVFASKQMISTLWINKNRF